MELNDLITGSMLGDGMITKLLSKTWNCYFQENHCLEQEEYLRFKGEILGSFL